MLVRLQTKNISSTLTAIQKVWKEAAPGSPMEYSFLDQEYQKLYVSEIRAQKLGSLFSIIAIIIACLGLYGSVMHIIRERVKEIGIRKVLGASASKIVAMLSIDLIRLLLISFTIAIPIAWYAMNQWLEDFASRIEMKWWMVVIAGFIVAAISIFTISYQAIKAAIANPVKSLRSE
jgi:putative ABC transport system permease protein